MENKIVLNSIYKQHNNIKYSYSIYGNIKKLFKRNVELILTYDYDVENIPDSILVIPFLGNILPLSWVFDFQIKIPDIDKTFYNQIELIKKGYINMYPNIKFLGELSVNNIVDNRKEILEKKEAVLFSGGVDAYLTVLENYENKPLLINLQGSEIDIDNYKAITNMQNILIDQANKLGLDIAFIKTNFRKMINEDIINFKIHKYTNESWWHGFQHGLAIICHAAPIAYVENINTLYISSSFTRGEEYKCASDPTIDNNVKFANCEIIHYGYDYTRQDKVLKICTIAEKKNMDIFLRVCFRTDQAENCNHCEKCYRTIFSIISLGYNPEKYGFNINKNFYKNAKRFFDYRMILNKQSSYKWLSIQQDMLKNKKDEEELNWFMNYNFANNSIIKYIIKYYYAIIKRIKKFFGGGLL